MEAATRSFLGIDADLWTAIGAISVPVVLGSLGFWIGRFQQQAQGASNRFVVDGIQRLHGSLSRLLSMHLQNFNVSVAIIRTLKTYEQDHPLAPLPEELPKYFGLEFENLPIESLLPVHELLGDNVLLEWVMLILSDVMAEARDGEFQIRQPTAAYYRKPVKLRLEEAVTRLNKITEAWNSQIAPHYAMLDRLSDLDNHIGRKQPWSVGGYHSLKNRKEVKAIVLAMKENFERVQRARKDARVILMSGGVE